ncbi:MAG: nicotinamide riboside transporter PnuC [Parvularculaceae bacterium]
MSSALDFLQEMIGARPIEIAAFLLGIANIALLVRRSVWNYPFGIATVILWAIVFFDARLYSDALLQIFFVVVQAYGWAHWLTRRDRQGLVIVERLAARSAILYGLVAIAITAGLGGFMASYTDAVFPFWDASVAALSVVAQIMLARRRLENWLVWIAVDIDAVALYWTRELYPAAALYMLFLVICIIGYFGWRRAWARGEAVAA